MIYDAMHSFVTEKGGGAKYDRQQMIMVIARTPCLIRRVNVFVLPTLGKRS